MPTIVRRGPYAAKVYAPPREHPPPHVHVLVGRRGVVQVRIGREGLPPEIISVEGDVDRRDVLEATRLVNAHETALLAVWEKLHGPAPDR